MPKPTIRFKTDHIELIDQTRLPLKVAYVRCRTVKSLHNAIRKLKVRGAPALGAAAAFGVLLAARKFRGKDTTKFLAHIHKTCAYLKTARPTAVNLFHALNGMERLCEENKGKSVAQLKALIKKKADEIYEEDRRLCRQMGKHGAKLIASGSTVMTICNTGALATVDYGTALGVMFSAKNKGKKFDVICCETRPLLQGARLNTWELMRARIPATLICDGAAAAVMKNRNVKAVFTGADRIAANGDTANKIGTYHLAVLAKHHGIPFYVVAPSTTFDISLRSGKEIPIEERGKEEVIRFAGKQTAPSGVNVYNPAFDVTPNKLITAIVTEKGVIKKPFRENIKKAICKITNNK